MTALFFYIRAISPARQAMTGLAAALALMAGAHGAAAQAIGPGNDGFPTTPIPLVPSQPAVPPQPPQPPREVPETPVGLPPGGGAIPFVPPALPLREQEALHKRLDDTYRGRDEAIKAMLDPTRIRLLSGYADADEAARLLYENGLEVAEELKLTPGIALTAQQVAALRKDIIWQVRIKKNGKELVVPRLYVAKGKIHKNDE